MYPDEFSDAPCGRGPGIRSRLHRRDVPANDRGDQPRIHFLPSDKDDVGRLHHSVGSFDHANEAAGFNETERFTGKFFCHGINCRLLTAEG